MQNAACIPLYSIGTRRTAFTTHFQIIFQKTKRAPFLVKRRRSSQSSNETIGQIKKPTNQTDAIILQDITPKCSRQVWFRTALGSSVIMTVSACSIRNRCIQFKSGFLLWLYSNTMHVRCQERSFDFNKFQLLAQIWKNVCSIIIRVHKKSASLHIEDLQIELKLYCVAVVLSLLCHNQCMLYN